MPHLIDRRQFIAGTAIVGTGAAAIAQVATAKQAAPSGEIKAAGNWNQIAIDDAAKVQAFVEFIKSTDPGKYSTLGDKINRWLTKLNFTAEIWADYTDIADIQNAFAMRYPTNDPPKLEMGPIGTAKSLAQLAKPRQVHTTLQIFHDKFTDRQPNNTNDWMIDHPGPGTTLQRLFNAVRAGRFQKMAIKHVVGAGGRTRTFLVVMK